MDHCQAGNAIVGHRASNHYMFPDDGVHDNFKHVYILLGKNAYVCRRVDAAFFIRPANILSCSEAQHESYEGWVDHVCIG